MMMDENKQLRHPSASGTRRTRVLRLDGFEPAEVLGADQREAFARRMVTLFDDGDAIRDGGFGSITRVHNIWGEVFALKTLSVDAGSCEVPDATLASFDREYRVHRSVSGLKGFPPCVRTRDGRWGGVHPYGMGGGCDAGQGCPSARRG